MQENTLPHMIPGKVYESLKLQKFVTKSFRFCKIIKMCKNILNACLFCYRFMLYVSCLQIEPQLIISKEYGREAPEKPSLYKIQDKM